VHPDVDPDGLDYLFVMTYGRSGSTLLSGVLNAIPGFLIRGENDDALRHLRAFSTTLLDARASWKDPPSRTRARTHPWFGIGDVPPRRLLEGTRRLALETVLRPKPGTRVIGYKEIRWRGPELDDHVDWLREVFPGARFVVNTRHLPDVARSGWWAEQDPVAVQRGLAEVERRQLEVAGRLGPAAFHVHFDDYVADPEALRPLFTWLDEPYDRATVDAVLARSHSLSNRGRSGGPDSA